MSMMASFLSAITILGVPSEIFIHGSQYMVNFVGLIIAIFLATTLFLPVFYEIDMISANQVRYYYKKVSVRKVGANQKASAASKKASSLRRKQAF
ncbi:hypothetical protein HPB48_010153 [Haemaphysalis longicornis]|uniref:Uncharacterized protein n=1 Tax=Haemaphysalis longicornis TaxID=44386 RepID=A0A9J6FMA6_HAELO|nr:hypothetical protein HPB48_010153 [Haemaphysalis longicornis]